MKKRDTLGRPVLTRACPTCGRTFGLAAFRRRDGGVCMRCIRAAADTARGVEAAQAEPVLPTRDIILNPGAVAVGVRARIVRLQRVDRVIRVLTAERLDDGTAYVFTALTVPVARIAELQQALTALAG